MHRNKPTDGTAQEPSTQVDQKGKHIECSESTTIQTPSKSAIKRQHADAFSLAELLLSTSKSSLQSLGLSEQLIQVILEAKKMPLDSGRKRQIKFIAKQLRDFDITGLRKGMTKKNSQPSKRRIYPEVESCISKLIEGGNQAIQVFCESYPSADRQHLRNIVRNRVKNEASNKKNYFHRELSLYLEPFIVVGD